MTLNDNLYTVDAYDAESRTFTISLNAADTIYKAHFPERPVTPGVCIIAVASELLERLTGREVQLTEVTNAKFLTVIDPLATPVVCYAFRKLTELPEGCKVNVEVVHNDVIYTKLSLIFKYR
ncbi:MAG: beta-hydroxyacyl-ACP dehydratase [Muribaculaceae bacterium]|nr:beta-hydroxyacyl-ACP dehydratase [Muribaculaceae bacterium]